MARIETDPNYTAPTFSRATATTDLFKATDVQSLAAAMSAHDHSTGKGLAIGGAGIAPNSIQTGHIIDAQIITQDIADGAITNVKHADRSIGASKIALSAITNTEIASQTILDGNLATTLIPPIGATLSVNQSATVLTVTAVGGGYGLLGTRKTYMLALSISSAGVLGGPIEFRLFSPYLTTLHGGGSQPYFQIGTFQYITVGGLSYWGVVTTFDASTLRFICTAQGAAWGYLGTNPSFACASGDRISMSLPFYP